ncbi:MAG: hypothetical protein V2J12_06245 [Gammaproteobacteria bacterium]|jgi:hypothetical protein|nr:hypothetical protein [Gammaproteobacteria bacterium]
MPLRLAIFAAALCLTACESGFVAVPDAAEATAIDAARMSCSRPYILEQDCSRTAGALGRFEIDGVAMKSAANGAGDRFVVFADSTRSTEKKSNRAYLALKSALTGNGFTILSVEPIARAGRLIGYAVKTDQPSYEFITSLN